MRRALVLPLAMMGLLLIARAARADVFISELCDPRLNYTSDRFIEIYNSGETGVDLTGWSVVAVGNGGDEFTWQLSGTIAAGDALVMGDATTVDVFTVDFADEAWSDNDGLWNGKVGDGAKLVDASSTIVDYVVVDATRFENSDYVRAEGITSPNTSFDPNEWNATPVDYPSQGSPGTHSTVPPVHTPSISAVASEPSAPLPGDDVYVQAMVTDEIATITSVTLAWGTSSSVLPNQITMVPYYGDFYQTQNPIPAQPAGSTVYYRVAAANDVPAAIETSSYSFQVPTTATIHEIQSEQSSSLLAGQPVVTSGVVAAFIGDYSVLQDGPGSWNGVWVSGTAPYTLGDSVLVRGVVSETSAAGFYGTTLLGQPLVLSRVSGSAIPAATSATSGTVSREDLEGVTVQLSGVMCTDTDRGGAWAADDGSGECLVGELAFPSSVTLGTVYDLTGVLMEANGIYRIQPRDLGDLVFVNDPTAPSIISVSAPNATTVIVTFTESVDPISAGLAAHYTISGLTVSAAQRDPSDFSSVNLTVSTMSEGSYSLTVDGVEDLFGNAIASTSKPYDYADYGPPAGYYDSAHGLVGENLRAALHAIIDDHQAHSYDFVWSAYYTTDVKPNGKVWDIYSDVPGGTPPYEYTLGVDQGGTGGSEGTGYTREHSWPKSWFGGEVSPMYTDIFALYPCDADVNGHRGNYPYGEVAVPQWTSLNGSKLGPCVYPGYSGTVFEPIDAYKGDLARTYFYMSTRYYTEDAGWPGSPMVEGADILPWALSMLLEWNDEDPVSLKELQRNAAIYEYQLNRNPYIDHPEYVHLVFGDITAAPEISSHSYQLSQNSPNPFNPATVIRFSLPQPSQVEIEVYDVSGRLVKTLVHEQYVAGEHEVTWRGKDARGRNVASGVYFYSMHAGTFSSSHKMLLAR